MRYRCYQINDTEPEGFAWFAKSIADYREQGVTLWRENYDYIVIIRLDEYRRYPFGNCGCSQGYRHKHTGWTIPDYCRQSGGCPEIWHKTKRRQLEVSEDSPILDYITANS
jgi:hypothetical protein